MGIGRSLLPGCWDGGRRLLGCGLGWSAGGGGTEAGTKAGASACNLVNCPPNDLPPVTVLSCGTGFVTRSGKVRVPPRPLLRFLRLSEPFRAWVVGGDSGMLDKVVMSAMLGRRVLLAVGF